MKLTRVLLLAALPAFIIAGCGGGNGAHASGNNGSEARTARPFRVTEIAQFSEPWAMAFLPDGRAIVTEKEGRLRILNRDRTLGTVAGVPAVGYGGQGGLLDVELSPTYAQDSLIYLTYAEPGPEGGEDHSSLALARARLVLDQAGGGRLDGLTVLWREMPKGGGGQFGGRLVFAPDGKSLFLSSGERMRKTPAQDPNTALGKIVHLTLDGAAAPDNPSFAAGGVRAQVWTSGHRNPYGLRFAPDGRLWETEMGPKGGDELNLIEPGRNYGWPEVSNGDNYDGSPIQRHATRPEFAAPKLWWNPSISPSSLMFYSGSLFPQWRGNAFIGALSGTALIRVTVNGANAAKADQWDMGERIRDVVQGPDGALWLLEDGAKGGGGKLLQLTPA